MMKQSRSEQIKANKEAVASIEKEPKPTRRQQFIASQKTKASQQNKQTNKQKDSTSCENSLIKRIRNCISSRALLRSGMSESTSWPVLNGHIPKIN